MAPGKALEQLALQKRFLRAEADVHRLALASEVQGLLAPFRWMERFQSQLRPILLFGAPVAGFWLTRRKRGMTRWVAVGLGLLRLLYTIRRFLRPSGS